jgi:oxygen-dependent protoporphyrinogen oxidase
MVTLAVPRLATDHPLDGSGFLVAGNEDLLMSACSFSSSKWAHLGPVPDSEPGSAGDTVLLRVSAGRHPDATPVELDDATLVATIRDELAAAIGLDPGLDLGSDRTRVTRWRRALPQYRPGHPARARGWRDALTSAWPGLWLAGASYDGLGIPACIADGDAVARQVASSIP